MAQTDVEKARMGSKSSLSMLETNMVLSKTASASNLPAIDPTEHQEVKKQNEQLIEDVNMLVRQNIELKSLLQAL